jgi:DNA-binding response OmpR family regulator
MTPSETLNPKMHILIVEDNLDIIANLFGFLEPLGYVLDVARSGNAGLEQASSGVYDVIVLDLSLPGMDGLEICRQLREVHLLSTPVLMLTARDTELDKLAGFDVGADDYLVKPYSLLELNARLNALMRRTRNGQLPSVLSYGELRVDTRTRSATRAGRILSLTPTGFTILVALLRHAPDVLIRKRLEREIWGDDLPESDALRTHIHTLRQSLDKSFDYAMLITYPGIGYRLVSANEA